MIIWTGGSFLVLVAIFVPIIEVYDLEGPLMLLVAGPLTAVAGVVLTMFAYYLSTDAGKESGWMTLALLGAALKSDLRDRPTLFFIPLELVGVLSCFGGIVWGLISGFS